MQWQLRMHFLETLKQMEITPVQPVACLLGFVGGMWQLMSAGPVPLTASIIGSGFVSLFLALFSIVGQSIGKWLIKEGKKKWVEYREKKRLKND